MNKSTLKTIDVLELIAENKNGITLTEIARELQMPMASTSDILKSLVEKKMVEIADLRTKTYKIGIKNLLLGNAYLANIDVVKVAMPYIDELSEQTSNTVFLGKLIDNRITYLYKREPKDFLISTCRIGSRAGLSVTSLGKVVLAHNEELQKQVLTAPLPQKTKYSITDPEILRKQLVEAKANGYAIDKQENVERILCIGFPVFDETNQVEHCIAISGVLQESRDIDREISLGKECTKIISRNLGYQG